MDVKLAVLADFASTTREGKLNILGVFDEMNPPQLPFALPIFYVVVSYEAGPAEFDSDKITHIVLTDGDGNPLLRLEQQFKVARAVRPGSKSITNQVNGIAGLPFTKAGDYQFAILVNEEEKKTISLRVNEPKKKS